MNLQPRRHRRSQMEEEMIGNRWQAGLRHVRGNPVAYLARKDFVGFRDPWVYTGS